MILIKRMNFILIGFLASLAFCCNLCFAESGSVTVPRNTVIPATATMQLSSQSLIQGQTVSVTVGNDFYYNNSLVVPIGSSINGTVTMVQKADKTGNDGKFNVSFTNILTPYGQMVPISGMIKTEDNSGIVYGNVTKDNTDEIVKNSIKGAAAASYIDKKNSNRAVVTGSAIGAGMGASGNTKGRPAVISVGEIVDVVLNQQSSFKPVQGYQY